METILGLCLMKMDNPGSSYMTSICFPRRIRINHYCPSSDDLAVLCSGCNAGVEELDAPAAIAPAAALARCVAAD